MTDVPPISSERKRSFGSYTFTLLETSELVPRNRRLRFGLPVGQELNFKAGQYVQMFIPYEGGVRRKAYSIASSPSHRDYFELCVTLVDGGLSSTHLHSMKPGDSIQGLAPLGNFHIQEVTRDLVFVATGSGVAPFRAMVNDLLERGVTNNMILLYGHRLESDFIYRSEWDDLARRHKNFRYVFTVSRDRNHVGEHGYVQDKIVPCIPDYLKKDFYMCGLSNMIMGVNDKLLSLGVPKNQIHFEKYD